MSVKIALAGNPNCGKTTLFNALTGANQFVGNWPGVTVEKKEGKLKGDRDVTIMDLPGIYSLSPYTPEEIVARTYLINERPDAVINIVDGTNIERNLYLTTQLLELGIPMVLAVNMMDAVDRAGDSIDMEKLSRRLGCQVLGISALKGTGVRETAEKAVSLARGKAAEKAVSLASGKAAEKAVSLARGKAAAKPFCCFSEKTEKIIEEAEGRLDASAPEGQKRFFAIRLLEKDEKIGALLKNAPDVSDLAGRLEDMFDDDVESIITNERYEYISSVVGECYRKKSGKKLTVSDKIDRVLTNRIAALPIFAIVMALVYYISVTGIGGAGTDWVNDVLFGEIIPPALENGLTAIGVSEWLKGLLLDGIVSGIGAVLGFLPQMLVLFVFLAFLEACGYMARVAFIMDRIFRKFGLSGKSFIPMLVASGCGVPGIMASRTIENDRDRKMTIMTTTFVPCGAKLPIIALIAGAFFNNAWWVAWSAYFVGVAAIICSGIILKKTRLFAGDPAPFVMELPAYHMPTPGAILRSVWERGWSFIKKAGTIILLSTIVLWFLMSFGWSENGFGMLEAEQLDSSILARIGSCIAWIFTPLGWTGAGEGWKMAVAAVTGLIAKENIIATFGMLFGFAEVAEDGAEIWGQLALVMTPVAAYGFLVFNLLCAPCFAAMGAIKREMNNARWFWTAIGYQTVLAYIVSMCIYQVGTLVTTGSFGAATAVSFLLILCFVYLLFRTDRTRKSGLSGNKKFA